MMCRNFTVWLFRKQVVVGIERTMDFELVENKLICIFSYQPIMTSKFQKQFGKSGLRRANMVNFFFFDSFLNA